MSLERHNLLAAPFATSHQQHLNGLIAIMHPNKFGWEDMECQEKFTEYLIAPENDYKRKIKPQSKKPMKKQKQEIAIYRATLQEVLDKDAAYRTMQIGKENNTTLMQECSPKQTLEEVQKPLMQEHFPKQTLVKVREADATSLTEQQLECHTTEEHISK